jgi:two-component system, cell cycle response regulator
VRQSKHVQRYVAPDYAERADRILAAIIGAMGDAVIAINADHRVIAFNGGAEELFGYDAEEVLGRPLDLLLPPERLAGHADRIEDFAREGTATRRMATREVVEGVRRDGTRFAAGATIASLADDGDWIGVAILRDISRQVASHDELKASLEEQQRLARTDPLTGLWNRRALVHALEREQARVERDGEPFTLVYLDLDGFKPINDTYGHAFGDRLLVTVATELSGFFRTMDFVARVGGDEFAILVTAGEARSMEPRLDALRRRLRTVMRDHGVAVTASIGALNCITPCASAERCLSAADLLMYQAKQATRDAVAVGILQGEDVTDAAGQRIRGIAAMACAS